ncbi:MAG TPA: amino acid ABC transporter ATP-binding protein [Clostridium sp.]|nr:amino acid ABC transporter ATP-binding protein [Clostridium sp.]
MNLQVEKGEVIAVIGPSGTGKSTLLRCINFLEHGDEGTITLGDINIDVKEIDKKSVLQIRRKTAMVFQSYNLFKNKTALENIMETLVTVKKMKKTEAKEIAMKYLKQVGLEEKKDSYPSKLSGGQQQRVAIARSIVHNPKVMLFDEPTIGLDVTASRTVQNFIFRCKKENKVIIFSSHSMREVEKLCDRVIIIHKGKIVEEGTIINLKEKYNNDDLEEVFLSLIGGESHEK